MNEKPQETQSGEQENLLEQIIAQGLEKINTPTQTAAAEESPELEAPSNLKQEDSADAAPAADRKNKRSAVYLYLLILFGAAFLMLLLAYFVQRRSSESAYNDLKDSMNLSREELLDQISAQEKEKGALFEEIDRLNSDIIQWQKRYDEKDGKLAESWGLLYAMQEEIYCYRSFLQLEQYYQVGDLESCAAIIILQMQGQTPYHAPDNTDERQEEIVKAVIKAGILGEDYVLHPDAYEDLLEAYFNRQTND